MKTKLISLVVLLLSFANTVFAQRQMEYLNRGVIAVNQGAGRVYVSWRMLGTDSPDISFNVYRSTDGAEAVKMNGSPIISTTDFVITGTDNTKSNTYFVKSVINGEEQEASESYTLRAQSPTRQYLSIPIKDGGAVQAQAVFGDIDGDGEYEMIIRWSKNGIVDPGRHPGVKATDKYYMDAYKLDGTFLWRIDLGWNIEPGMDYSPFLVHDIDGCGKAEIITRTADGTFDGTGKLLGRDVQLSDNSGKVVQGSEWLTVFRGTDGAEIASTPYIERGNIANDWRDSNRANRYQLGIAYLDGVRPTIIMSRGVYAYQVMEAWNFRDGNLSRLWRWDNGGKGTLQYYYSVDQCFRMGDVDGDGRDEIIRGQLTVNHEGKEVWNLKIMRGHGDFTCIGDFMPDRPGLEIFQINETPLENGVAMHDAKTGEVIWGIDINGDSGRGYVGSIVPNIRGVQCWAGQINEDFINYDGTVLCPGKSPSRLNGNMYWAPIWWDDVTRSLTNEHTGSIGAQIVRWNYPNCANVSVTELTRVGTTTRSIIYIGDLFGDWREEIVTFTANEVRIYTTTIPAKKRLYALMHNPLYRLNVGQWGQRNPAPSYPDYYLGAMMDEPPMPNIYVVKADDNVSMKTEKMSDNIVLYPNPVVDKLTVSVADLAKQTKVNIYNLNGMLIYSSEITGSTAEIDMSRYASGMYIVKLVNDKGIFVKRVIKK